MKEKYNFCVYALFSFLSSNVIFGFSSPIKRLTEYSTLQVLKRSPSFFPGLASLIVVSPRKSQRYPKLILSSFFFFDLRSHVNVKL